MMDPASAEAQLQVMAAQFAQLQAYMPIYFGVQDVLVSSRTFLAVMTAIVIFVSNPPQQLGRYCLSLTRSYPGYSPTGPLCYHAYGNQICLAGTNNMAQCLSPRQQVWHNCGIDSYSVPCESFHALLPGSCLARVAK